MFVILGKIDSSTLYIFGYNSRYFIGNILFVICTRQNSFKCFDSITDKVVSQYKVISLLTA